MAEEKDKQTQKDAEEQGQPSNDASIYHEDVDQTAVGSPTEEPRPQPETPLAREQREIADKDREAIAGGKSVGELQAEKQKDLDKQREKAEDREATGQDKQAQQAAADSQAGGPRRAKAQ